MTKTLCRVLVYLIDNPIADFQTSICIIMRGKHRKGIAQKSWCGFHQSMIWLAFCHYALSHWGHNGYWFSQLKRICFQSLEGFSWMSINAFKIKNVHSVCVATAKLLICCSAAAYLDTNMQSKWPVCTVGPSGVLASRRASASSWGRVWSCAERWDVSLRWASVMSGQSWDKCWIEPSQIAGQA